MKNLSIAILLCVFTIPASAGLKGKIGSSEFCSSTKRYAHNTLVTYQMRLESYHVAIDAGTPGERRHHEKAAEDALKSLHVVSNIYSAWCK